MSLRYDVVIPTVGRPSLTVLLDVLARNPGPYPSRILVVDDRTEPDPPLSLAAPEPIGDSVRIVRGAAVGPAAARNLGWRSAAAPWIVFLDDDVLVTETWTADLVRDLLHAEDGVAGVQGRIRVPLPAGRRATEWERTLHGLERAAWATADMAYRREVLEEVGGFDTRFPRPGREDADLALRVQEAGYELRRGRRWALHLVRPADAAVSVRLQARHADDALMRALHGPGWRRKARVPRGRLPLHVATTGAGLVALAGAALGRRPWAAAGAGAWLAATAQLAWARIAPGPRTAEEVRTMLWTSAVIPAAATLEHLRGRMHARRVVPRPRTAPRPPYDVPQAVLFDRDGTLIRDVSNNGDPVRVAPMPGARRAVARVRAAGIPVGVITNQSGIGRGVLTEEQVAAVHRRVDELLGPFDCWVLCPHAPHEGCACKKPAPGMVKEAAERLGVRPERCLVIGDLASDVEAARAAGARGILVPNEATRPQEVAAADEIATSLEDAVATALGERPGRLSGSAAARGRSRRARPRPRA